MNSEKRLSWFDPTDLPRALRLIRLLSWIVIGLAGFLQVWASRFTVTSDGNSYLDVAAAYLHRDWHNAINAYWSPLFSWLLAFCMAILHPSPYWESTILHLLNFAALLVSLLCFEFFFRSFLKMGTRLGPSGSEAQGLPELGWWALGYGLFASTSLFVLTVSLSTPDVWVAALTYLAAGFLVRVYSSGGGWHRFAALGFVLGCAYLTKTFYFPMSFVFLLTAWLAAGNRKKALPQAALGVLIFFLVAGPWVVTLSRVKHRFTFGDVGKLAFFIRTVPIAQPYVWQGESGTGIPVHPVRQLLSKPALYEFATPIAGSYPPAYDQTYWLEGANVRFSLKTTLVILRQSAGTIFQFLVDQLEFAMGLVVVFFFLVQGQSGWFASLRQRWFLWVPPLIACLSYSAVLLEGRYVAPFLLLLWIAGFSSLLSLSSRIPRTIAVALLLAMLSLAGLRIAKFAVSDTLAGLSHPPNTDYEVAQGLHNLGIHPGDRIAGLSRVTEAHWARLAGVKIVAEIPLGNELFFWTAPPDLQRKVLDLVAGTGAKAIVTNGSSPSAINAGWTPLGTTGYYVLLLPPQPPRSAP